jgi:DnaJ-class molecular chaperone
MTKKNISNILDKLILGELTHAEAESKLSGLFSITRSDLQLCPKCNGQGIVTKPPWIAGDVYEWSSTQASYTCDVCNGAKVI